MSRVAVYNRRSITESLFQIAPLERDFGATIKKGQSVEERARKGHQFVSNKPEELRRLAIAPDALPAETFFLPEGEAGAPNRPDFWSNILSTSVICFSPVPWRRYSPHL
jgi:hypothetical protein